MQCKVRVSVHATGRVVPLLAHDRQEFVFGIASELLNGCPWVCPWVGVFRWFDGVIGVGEVVALPVGCCMVRGVTFAQMWFPSTVAKCKLYGLSVFAPHRGSVFQDVEEAVRRQLFLEVVECEVEGIKVPSRKP